MNEQYWSEFILGTGYKDKIVVTNGLYWATVPEKFPDTDINPPHYHGNIEIVVPIGLEGEAYIGGKRYEIKEGCVYCIPPETTHSLIYEPIVKDNSVAVLQIKPDAFNNLLNSYCISLKDIFLHQITNAKIVQKENAKEVYQLISQLMYLDDPMDLSKPISIHSILEDILKLERILSIVLVHTEKKKPINAGKSETKLRGIISHLGSMAFEPDISLDDVAKECSTSKYYLCRFFKARTGITIQTYINKLRVDRAQYLMSSQGKNVTEACYECGFQSVSYFIQVFSKMVGKTPKKWIQEENANS